MGQGPEIQVELVLNSNKTLGILPWWCLIDLSPIISSANGRFRPYDFSRLLQSHCLFMWPHFFTEAQWWESTCTSAICFCSYVSSTYNVFFPLCFLKSHSLVYFGHISDRALSRSLWPSLLPSRLPENDCLLFPADELCVIIKQSFPLDLELGPWLHGITAA